MRIKFALTDQEAAEARVGCPLDDSSRQSWMSHRPRRPISPAPSYPTNTAACSELPTVRTSRRADSRRLHPQGLASRTFHVKQSQGDRSPGDPLRPMAGTAHPHTGHQPHHALSCRPDPNPCLRSRPGHQPPGTIGGSDGRATVSPRVTHAKSGQRPRLDVCGVAHHEVWCEPSRHTNRTPHATTSGTPCSYGQFMMTRDTVTRSGRL